MQDIKIGDLVYRENRSKFITRHNNEIWIATDICSCDGKVRIVSIHNQDTVLTCNPHMLIKIDTEEV
jgi:hypothetical protein